MQSPSRRAFLSGHRVERSPWEAFMTRLRRAIQGQVYDFSTPEGSARLLPGHMQDVYRARALCHEYGITLALDGLPSANPRDDSPVLWVEPGSAMARCERLGDGDPRWFVQPGCLVAELETAGLPQFKDQPPHLTVAAWLADRRGCDWGRGQTADSGLVHALVLLSDGTQANLGAFGVDNHKPLDNLRVQEMIPKLFELNASLAGQPASPDALWDGRYRLDALSPVEGQTINLSHLLLGHGGELGWVEWLVFDERVGRPGSRPYETRYGQRQAANDTHAADGAVRALFDPGGLFPSRGQDFNHHYGSDI